MTTSNASAGTDNFRSILQNVSSKRLSFLVFFILFVLFAIPSQLGLRWMLVMTAVVIYSIVTLGLGVLIGRAGLVSICQLVLFASGAWVSLRVNYLIALPLPINLLIAGIVTAIVGVLVGLPALRLSGLYLALITLMAAGGITLLLSRTKFPNGGGGFTGNSKAFGVTSLLPRPVFALGDVAYYRYCVVVALVLFLFVTWQVRGRAGRAWAAIRQGDTTALAAGVNTTFYKLWAFAIAAFCAGIGGGLLAASRGGVSVNQFPVQGSVLMLAVVLMGGVFNIWGAIVSAVFLKLIPELLLQWGLPTEWGTILFGVGLMQVLLTSPGGISDQLPKDLKKLSGLIIGLITRGPKNIEKVK